MMIINKVKNLKLKKSHKKDKQDNQINNLEKKKIKFIQKVKKMSMTKWNPLKMKCLKREMILIKMVDTHKIIWKKK